MPRPHEALDDGVVPDGGAEIVAVGVDGVRKVYVRPPVQQQMGHLQIVALDGHHQRRLTVILLGRGLGQAGDQVGVFIQNGRDLLQIAPADHGKQLFHGSSLLPICRASRFAVRFSLRS